MTPRRTLALAAWLTVPLLWVGWHYGPGHESLARDNASAHLKQVQVSYAGGNFEDVISQVDAALAALPETERETSFRLRLIKSQAKMNSGALDEARDEFEGLLDEAAGFSDKSLANTARESLATAQYYTTWNMRLQGLPREEWEQEAEATRQNFRVLAETADSKIQVSYQEKLESSIRLARMDLSDLQGLPLPKECNCKNPGKKPGKKKANKPSDKKEDARGSGKGPPVDGSGH